MISDNKITINAKTSTVKKDFISVFCALIKLYSSKIPNPNKPKPQKIEHIANFLEVLSVAHTGNLEKLKANLELK